MKKINKADINKNYRNDYSNENYRHDYKINQINLV
jgi:hypothetical protein